MLALCQAVFLVHPEAGLKWEVSCFVALGQPMAETGSGPSMSRLLPKVALSLELELARYAAFEVEI